MQFHGNAETCMYEKEGVYVVGTLTCQVKRDRVGLPLLTVNYFSPVLKRIK